MRGVRSAMASAAAETIRVGPLRGLSEAAIRVVVERGRIHRYRPGQVLWRAGSEPRGLHFVLQGEVRVVRAVRGRQRLVHTEAGGGTLGEVPLFAGGGYPATAVAVTPVECLVLDRAALAAAVGADPALAFSLLERLACRVRELVARLDGTALPVEARVAAYLTERRRRTGADTFTLGRTQLEVAEELGTVREVVVRVLRSFRQAGLIASAGRGRIEVLDAARLEERARRSG